MFTDVLRAGSRVGSTAPGTSMWPTTTDTVVGVGTANVRRRETHCKAAGAEWGAV